MTSRVLRFPVRPDRRFRGRAPTLHELNGHTFPGWLPPQELRRARPRRDLCRALLGGIGVALLIIACWALILVGLVGGAA